MGFQNDSTVFRLSLDPQLASVFDDNRNYAFSKVQCSSRNKERNRERERETHS